MKGLNQLFKAQSSLLKMTNGFCQLGLETVFWILKGSLLELCAFCSWRLCQKLGEFDGGMFEVGITFYVSRLKQAAHSGIRI